MYFLEFSTNCIKSFLMFSQYYFENYLQISEKYAHTVREGFLQRPKFLRFCTEGSNGQILASKCGSTGCENKEKSVQYRKKVIPLWKATPLIAESCSQSYTLLYPISLHLKKLVLWTSFPLTKENHNLIHPLWTGSAHFSPNLFTHAGLPLSVKLGKLREFG